MPPATKTLRDLPIAPTVQAIIVDRVPVIDPKLAAIIGDNAESVIACLENAQAACPTHSKVIASGKPRPSATRVAIVHHVLPTSHIWLAAVQVLATATLTKEVSVFSEEAMAISGTMPTFTATRLHDSPSISSIRTVVPEEHASMAAALKHLQSDQMPTSAHMWSGLSIAPAMQAIVVNCVSVVDPQLAPIIRDNTKMVMTCPEDSQAACPPHSKVVASDKSRPFATCVAVVHHVFPASHVRSAIIQILATSTLTKVEGILPEQTMTIRDLM